MVTMVTYERHILFQIQVQFIYAYRYKNFLDLEHKWKDNRFSWSNKIEAKHLNTRVILFVFPLTL